MYSETTEKRKYPLPHADNYLEEDVEQLREALGKIDTDVDEIGTGLAGVAERMTATEEAFTELSEGVDAFKEGLDIALGERDEQLAEVLKDKADLGKDRLIPLGQLPVEHLGKIDVVPDGFGAETGQATRRMPTTVHKFIFAPGLGLYMFDKQATDPPDGETCILPEEGDGRWMLVAPGVEWLLALVKTSDPGRLASVESVVATLMARAELMLGCSATLTWGALAAYGGNQALTISAAGAAVGDAVVVTPPIGLASGIVYHGYVSAANVVTVRCTNCTSAAITPAAATWKVIVLKEG